MPYSKKPPRSGAKRNPPGTRPGGTTKPEGRPVKPKVPGGHNGPTPPPEVNDRPENPPRSPAKSVIDPGDVWPRPLN